MRKRAPDRWLSYCFYANFMPNDFDKAVKKTLTIPAWLNTAAMEQGINFSKVLQDALKKQLNLG